ncbi:unnamed protein product [Caenorhabditis brenneri]
MNSYIFPLLLCCTLLRFSFCAECSTQTVDLSVVNSYNILSNSSDLAPKTCIYTFTVPKYFVPSVAIVNVHLTGENTITVGQSKEYGGTRIYGITKDTQLNLAPVNFTIEIDLKNKTPNDSFSILITVKDKSPAAIGTNFVVRKDLGTLIDFGDVWGNSTTVQKFDAINPQAQSYTIRVAVFSPIAATFSLMDMVYVYDNGVYKGSLLDVYTAGMNNQVCSGTKFEIVNSLSSTIGPFTILISEMHEWAEKTVTATSAPNSNTTQTLSSLNDLLVIHEISNPLLGELVPFYYQQLSIKEGTELKIYAGCVTGAQENRRIATITPSNAHNYENIEFTGRCKTFVLTRGSIQWQSFHAFPINTYRSEIGRQGVVMSTNFPYPNMDNSTRNYLIQSPSADSKENIIVTYEIASMASDVDFNIEEDIKASQSTGKTLTSNDKTFTSVSTYQQYILYKAPINSDGFLIRYTVTSSANLTSLYFVLLLIIFKFM